jgi:hypothetical protein
MYCIGFTVSSIRLVISALLASGRPDARGCSSFLRLMLLLLGNCTPTSCLCPDARALSTFAPAPSACRTRMPRRDCLHPCRHHPLLPAFAAEKRSIPPLPHTHERHPSSCSRRLWQGGSYCNMCNIPISF